MDTACAEDPSLAAALAAAALAAAHAAALAAAALAAALAAGAALVPVELPTGRGCRVTNSACAARHDPR